MKFRLSLVLSLLFTAFLGASAMADIQDPPVNDQGPTRKLGRGIANIVWAPAEFFNTVNLINEREGNSAAAGYGIIKGVGRSFYRFGVGFYEVATFPFPTHKGSYRQPYPSNIPWIHGGYEEFPPELGWDSKLSYVGAHTAY